MVKLPKTSYDWALKHLIIEGDTDLFPTPFEIDAIKFNWPRVRDSLSNLDLSSYEWNGGRRFTVPKGKLSFRNATQLDPLDSLILAGIVKQYGRKIEAARIPVAENRVFSFRFNPLSGGRFYGEQSNWHDFWKTSRKKASNENCNWVAITDITDCYNQIYHHVLENQLVDVGLPKPVVKVIFNLLGKLTHGVSRGIPIGPHSVHLLAECALIPIDKSLLSHGYDFCRFVDDVHFFCESQEKAQIAVYDFADIVDKQQRFALQRKKTRIVPAREFVDYANLMLEDRPLNDDEKEIMQIIKKHSTNNPYGLIKLGELTEAERKLLSTEKLTELFALYLHEEPRNYPRIGWLLRRLSQIGAPGAIDYLLQNISDFTPVLGNIARYIMRASANYSGDLENAGELILRALEIPLIKHSEYTQMILIDLFAKVPQLDHLNDLTKLYPNLRSSVRREIIVAAGVGGQGHWVKERKDEFAISDPWFRQALVYAAISLPGDEAKHWTNKIKHNMSTMEKLVAMWAFKNKDLKLGNLSIG